MRKPNNIQFNLNDDQGNIAAALSEGEALLTRLSFLLPRPYVALRNLACSNATGDEHPVAKGAEK